MKNYPSVWITMITKQLKEIKGNDVLPVWDISVKLTADSSVVHYQKNSLDEAKKFCTERYGKYDSIREMI